VTAHYMDLLFTPEVMREQSDHGSRSSYARMANGALADPDNLGPKEAMFLAGPMSSIAAARPVSSSFSATAKSASPIIAAIGNMSALATSRPMIVSPCSSWIMCEGLG
jgi:hypothetical protein